MTDLGSRITELRLAAGWSRGQLADRLNRAAGKATVTKDEVKRWEDGGRRAGPTWLPHLATVLGVPVEALTDPLPNPLRVAHEWLIADSPQTVEARTGRRIGADLARKVAERVVELRHLDDELGGQDLAPVVLKELSDTETLIRNAAYTDAVGRSLLISLGELAQVAGWVASDAGRHHTAQRVYLEGVDAATEAGDRALGANLLSCLSYQVANLGRRPDDAFLLARSAAKGAGGAAPIVQALLTERVAWAAAKAGRGDAALRALDQVDDLFEARGDDPEPEWVYWVNRQEVSVMRARVMVELQRPREAEELLTGVLTQYPAELARESALYWSWLAEAYATAGDHDAARQALNTATDHARRIHSSRADDRLAAINAKIEAVAS